MNTYGKLFRWGNGLIVGVGVILGYICVPSNFNALQMILGILTLISLTIAGNIHNDICDIEIDKSAHADRPLVTGEVSLLQAWFLTLLFLAMGLCLPILATPTHLKLSMGITLLLIIYNYWLKKMPLIGNAIIALLCSLPIYYAEFPAPPLYTLLPCLFAFCMTLAREVIKDIEDKTADEQAGLRTYPITQGIPAAITLSRFCLVFVVILLPLPVLFSMYHWSYFIVILLFTSYPFFKIFAQLNSMNTNFHTVQKLLKTIMFWGLIALAAGQF